VSEPIQVSVVEVQATERLMTIPEEIPHRVDADLGGRATLLGYRLDTMTVARGAEWPVTLYWQAQREMSVSYKVFVQLVGPDGVLAQRDAVPGKWTRPTTGWVPGEVIVDEYTLRIPDDAAGGTYRLIAGMYDERSLRRLARLDATGAAVGDHVALQEATVVP
jgi:hypothetical protein